MEYGLGIPSRGPMASAEAIATIARRAEALGFTHLAVSDHIIVPRSIASRYPYSGDGQWPGKTGGECLEQLTLLAWLAAVTEKARLLPSVMVVPHRAPVHTAKILATIDQLSAGRVTLGVGAGWMEEEFKALGAPPFPARGKVTDEYLEAFRVLWTEPHPAYSGEFVQFDDVSFYPKPVQQPGPPIWVGGESKAAMRRTVRLGDAWYPIGSNPRHPLNTVARLRAGIETLHRLSEEHGRDPSTITLTYWANWFDESAGEIRDDGERRLFTGDAARIAADIAALGELGVTHQLFNFQRKDLASTIAAMEHFVAEILPRVG
ncbi:MAG: LLM class F420-dependent oxidoreductase [Ectothiorhodospiraceae bacterium]|nr:LLM class F420-dependent oxidoreductase [Chromatiales bacterium]MCP5153298.1 LLM class F420-dependent oxidoreductase [Ectothiorhodospiraceae bacterium]